MKNLKNDNQKFSIIMAVYNGQANIAETIQAIYRLNYSHKNLELVVVDDFSTDNTRRILAELKDKLKDDPLKFKIVHNEKNEGRIKSRLKAAVNSSNKRILILDLQSEIEPDTLNYTHQFSQNATIISNYYMKKERSLEDRVLYLLRKKYYAPYWGVTFPDVKLTKDNFKKISKGTGGLITDRDTFITYSKKFKGEKFENDDTKLLWEYVKDGKELIRTSKVKILYKNRTGVSSIKHLFKRGPQFVDFYINNIYKILFVTITPLILISIFLLLCIFNPLFLLIICSGTIIINLLLAIYLSEELIDVIYVFIYLPITFISFGSGVYLNALKRLFK